MHRVLIADDDPAMRGMLESALSRQGFSVETAASGEELLALLKTAQAEERTPHLVISDVCMPGMSGLDVLHHIRRELPQLPVLLITAFGDALTHRRAQALGAVELIDKPFDLTLLCSRAKHVALESPIT
ncbi:response regulator [Haliangium ochraceum]|uniref:Response regulator receiver protein n=1 Tax=Haliangium ochraceum (strain DSM 14365 / JCM 11303 / SMP-2) TaxID=502025 RepID=D0LHZ5_HALO1|nr:response regulator [Haliangium ochraceum]ACY14824.1 response regulator receiver protein [Haliangium ochraceum DSM 14365]